MGLYRLSESGDEAPKMNETLVKKELSRPSVPQPEQVSQPIQVHITGNTEVPEKKRRYELNSIHCNLNIHTSFWSQKPISSFFTVPLLYVI